MKEGTYNEDVNDNLNARQRTGTISRKDYWDIFPERKDSYLSDINVVNLSPKALIFQGYRALFFLKNF